MIETLEKARQLRNQQKNKAANILFDQIINTTNVDSNTFYYAVTEKVDMLMREKSFEDALNTLDLAISKNIYKYNFLIKKGTLLEKIDPENEPLICKTFEEALAIAENNLKQDPTNGDYYVDKARVLNFLCKYLEAIETCELGIEFTADDPTLASLYRQIYISCKNYTFEISNEDFTLFNKGFDYLLKAHSMQHNFQHDYNFELNDARNLYERNKKVLEINKELSTDPTNIFLHLAKIQNLYGEKKATAIEKAALMSKKPYAKALLEFEELFTYNYSSSLTGLTQTLNKLEPIVEVILTTNTDEMDYNERQLYKTHFEKICSYIGLLCKSLGDKISNEQRKRAAHEITTDFYQLAKHSSYAEMYNKLGYGIFSNRRPDATLESALKLFKARPKFS